MLSKIRVPWNTSLTRSSRWHGSDPRIRLVVSAVFPVMALTSRSWTDLGLAYLFILLLFSSSSTGIAGALRSLRPFAFLLSLTLLLHLFFLPGVILSGGASSALPDTLSGLSRSFLIVGRLAAVILVSTHLVATTSPLELSRSISWLLLPLRKTGFPAAETAILLNLGFHFFPIVIDESQNLRLALESRGISIGHRKVSLRFKAAAAWFFAIISAVLERSERLAAALELKGCTLNTSSRFSFPPWSGESITIAAALCTILLLWVPLRFTGILDRMLSGF